MKHGYTTFGVRKGLPFTPYLNYEIIKLQSSGVMQHIMERNAHKRHAICQEIKSFDDKDQINFKKVIFPFSIIILGVFMSIIFLTVEIIK